MKTSANVQQVSSIRGRRLLTVGLFLIGLVACLAIGISTAQAQTYNVKNMGILDGMKACEPAAMNELGFVAGTATAGDLHAAFLYYYDEKEEEMKDVGGFGSRGFGINPAGIIVGDLTIPSKSMPVSHAALFNGEGARDLGVLMGQTFSRANGINAMRQVVGFSGPTRDSAQSRAFIWTSLTGMIDIGTLGGSYAQATAINGPGWVTGTSQLLGAQKGQTHAFIYQPLSQTEGLLEPMRDLGTLGGLSSYGTAINARNHVVGYSTINGGLVHAFLHDGQRMIDLGTLEKEGYYQSAALAVNNADQVVGVSYTQANDNGQPDQAAFIWRRDANKVAHMINLNTLIEPSGKSLWILSAKAINDSGQIAASAYDSANDTVSAVLLTPVK